MKNTLPALISLIVALILIPTFAYAQAWPTTAATAAHTINNGSFTQGWEWNSLTNSGGLELSGSATTTGGAASVLGVALSGSNTTSGVSSYAIYATNFVNGTTSTDYGLFAIAAEGSTHNYAVYGELQDHHAGDAGVWGDATASTGATYGIYGTNASSAGYAGYFNNSAGGYAAAFMGGNVGIGTATPQSLVHAYGGEVQVGSSGASCTANNNGAIRFGSSTLYYCTGTTWTTVRSSGDTPAGSNGQVQFNNSGTMGADSNFNWDNTNKRLGIGTATPLTSLEVYGGVIEGAQLAIGTSSTDGLLLANTTAATASIQQYSPRLHFTGQGWKTNTTAASEAVDFIEEVQPASASSAPTGNLVWSNAINGGSYSALMALTSGGNVGIGNTSPLAQLSVGSGSLTDTNTPVQISAPASGQAWFGVNKNGAYGLLTGYITNGALSGNGAYVRQIPTDPLYFVVNNTTTAMTILSSGNVLVGYTSSQNACCVFQVNGTIGATSTSITSLSDKRLKTDIAPLGASLPIIMALNPVSFQFVKDQMTPAGAKLAAQQKAPRSKSASASVTGFLQPKPDVYNFPAGTQVGFTAQDVAEAVKNTPYLSALVDVPAKPDSDYYTLREGNMIPLLVKAMQELNKRLTDDETTIAILKTKLKTQ